MGRPKSPRGEGTSQEASSADVREALSDDDFAGSGAVAKSSKLQKTCAASSKSSSSAKSSEHELPPAPAAKEPAAPAAGVAALGTAAAASAPAAPPARVPNPHAGTSAGAVLDWLEQYNCPVNAQMVADQFRSTMTKAQAEKALVTLCETGHADLKEAGKAKVYWVNQDHINVPSEAELGSIARQIDAAAAERQATEAELNRLKAACKATSNQKSLVELRAEKLALEERVWKKQSDLATLRSSSAKGEKPLSEKESHAAVNAYSKMLREVKRRRSICLEMLSNVGEGTGKSRKQLMNEWSLEGDEENDFDLSRFPLLPVSALRQISGGKSTRR